MSTSFEPAIHGPVIPTSLAPCVVDGSGVKYPDPEPESDGKDFQCETTLGANIDEVDFGLIAMIEV